LLVGILFATGRRTVTSWFRAAGIGTDYRHGYTTVGAVGSKVPLLALSTLQAVRPLRRPQRLMLA
jgi:hypothetical protein